MIVDQRDVGIRHLPVATRVAQQRDHHGVGVADDRVGAVVRVGESSGDVHVKRALVGQRSGGELDDERLVGVLEGDRVGHVGGLRVRDAHGRGIDKHDGSVELHRDLLDPAEPRLDRGQQAFIGRGI